MQHFRDIPATVVQRLHDAVGVRVWPPRSGFFLCSLIALSATLCSFARECVSDVLTRFVQRPVRFCTTDAPTQIDSERWPFRLLPEIALELLVRIVGLRVRNLLVDDEEHETLIVSRRPPVVRLFFVMHRLLL